jgi:hypothetical protein
VTNGSEKLPENARGPGPNATQWKGSANMASPGAKNASCTSGGGSVSSLRLGS